MVTWRWHAGWRTSQVISAPVDQCGCRNCNELDQKRRQRAHRDRAGVITRAQLPAPLLLPHHADLWHDRHSTGFIGPCYVTWGHFKVFAKQDVRLYKPLHHATPNTQHTLDLCMSLEWAHDVCS